MVPLGSALFSLISARMAWLGARHGVLAQNVANADTPGYVPQDLREPKFDDLLSISAGHRGTLAVRRTRAGHIAPGGTPASGQRSRDQRLLFEVAPDGNAVVLEQQIAKMSENNINYQLTSNLYRKYVGMVRTALGPNQ
jgi:flagellar basal-body rod protein FlgB